MKGFRCDKEFSDRLNVLVEDSGMDLGEVIRRCIAYGNKEFLSKHCDKVAVNKALTKKEEDDTCYKCSIGLICNTHNA